MIDEAAITPKRIEVKCQCGRRHEFDVTRAVKLAIDESAVGGFEFPAGNYEALVMIGHAGTFVSGMLRKL